MFEIVEREENQSLKKLETLTEKEISLKDCNSPIYRPQGLASPSRQVVASISKRQLGELTLLSYNFTLQANLALGADSEVNNFAKYLASPAGQASPVGSNSGAD